MPLNYRIHTERRLVVARGSGVLKDEEVFTYQLEVWSRPEVAGFDELVDMTNVTRILLPSIERVRDLAELSANMGQSAPRSKLAVVAPDDLAFGLGRMYEVARESAAPRVKPVSIFRTMPEALAWLGIEDGDGSEL
jgi:hypothetical protein